jgi:hypothetical protein
MVRSDARQCTFEDDPWLGRVGKAGPQGSGSHEPRRRGARVTLLLPSCQGAVRPCWPDKSRHQVLGRIDGLVEGTVLRSPERRGSVIRSTQLSGREHTLAQPGMQTDPRLRAPPARTAPTWFRADSGFESSGSGAFPGAVWQTSGQPRCWGTLPNQSTATARLSRRMHLPLRSYRQLAPRPGAPYRDDALALRETIVTRRS